CRKSEHSSISGGLPQGNVVLGRWPCVRAADILRPMAEAPDLASLAKRYLDLWQEHLIAMAADPELAENMAPFLAALRPPPAAPPNAAHHGEPAPRAASAAAPSRERGDVVAELLRRVAALEERLAALEGGARSPRQRARAKPRRRRA